MKTFSFPFLPIDLRFYSEAQLISFFQTIFELLALDYFSFSLMSLCVSKFEYWAKILYKILKKIILSCQEKNKGIINHYNML